MKRIDEQGRKIVRDMPASAVFSVFFATRLGSGAGVFQSGVSCPACCHLTVQGADQ